MRVADPPQKTTECVYNTTGSLQNVKLADNTMTTFAYDTMGRLSRIDHVGTSDCVEYGYDAAGRRASMTDTRLPSADLGGQTYAWEYDGLVGLTTERYCCDTALHMLRGAMLYAHTTR